MKNLAKKLGSAAVGALGLWAALELGTRLYLELPLKTDFYSSIPRARVARRQSEHRVKTNAGPGWVHLAWIADPEQETYRIEQWSSGNWQTIGRAEFGSFLVHGAGGAFRVWAEPRSGQRPRLVGEAATSPHPGSSPLYRPVIAGKWQPLFRPSQAGAYINDHCIYQDGQGNWRLIGITSYSQGEFNQEKQFAVGVGPDFPPPGGWREAQPVANFDELAWAPFVLPAAGRYRLFWSPHRLHQMDSPDGIHWTDQRLSLPAPYHKFFRDPMILQAAEDQWLLYATARGAYYSRVDLYQSFNLEEWQYIRPALSSRWGSERNAPFASMESPNVAEYQGRYYLSVTYNNDSTFLPGWLLLARIWPNPASYNDTLVFHADNPYDFGIYHGRGRTPGLLAQLQTHAPEWVYHPGKDAWFITTAGWPWVSTLTSGEVAVAPLEWRPVLLPGTRSKA